MSGPIGSILIPTDNSDGAITGAKIGIALASKTGAAIHILSVVDVPVDSPDDDALLSTLEEDAYDAVEQVERLARAHDTTLSVTTSVTRGTPFQSIRAYAHRREIDVIAMGTKGRSGLDRVVLGSVTENVLRTARTPILAVPPAAWIESIGEQSFDTMLLPTDGSEGAEIAAKWCITLADRLNAMVHTIFSVDTSRFSDRGEPGEIVGALEQRGEDAIERVTDRAKAAGVSIAAMVARGPPVRVILDSATEKEVDLIVMGTHGRTGIGQWFLGSVTENVVRGADVPVLCVPVSAKEP